MRSRDIPIDVWKIVKDFIAQPKDHISLSQACRSSRSAYAPPGTWRGLCRMIGVGRTMRDKGDNDPVGWRKVFIVVVSHRDRCRLPQCYQYGVPPMYMVGDLLATPEAALQHYEYFRTGPAADRCGCDDCDITAMDSGDARDPTVQLSQAGEEGDTFDNDMESTAGNLNPIDAMMMMLMGMPLPGPPSNPMPTTDSASPPSPNADVPAPAAALGAGDKGRDKIQPKLLPLSMRNRAKVPGRPHLHDHIFETGFVGFQDFLSGEISMRRGTYSCQYGNEVPGTNKGIDWDGERPAKGKSMVRSLFDHPILARAYATNPPISKLWVYIEDICKKVINKEGVTILDVVDQVREYLEGAMTDKDRTRIKTRARYDQSEEDLESQQGTRWTYLHHCEPGAVEECNGIEAIVMVAHIRFDAKTGRTTLFLRHR